MKTILEKLDSYLGTGKVCGIGMSCDSPGFVGETPIKEASNQTLPPTEEQAEEIGYIVENFIRGETFEQNMHDMCQAIGSGDSEDCTKILNFVKGRIDKSSIKDLLKM
jgi:hypothetical protein